MPRLRSLAALAALLSIGAAQACAPPPAPAVAPAAVVVRAPAPPAGPDAGRFHVLMINGGGEPSINFQPHLLHLRALRDTLLASGIRADHVAVFASDGSDPTPDLVSRAAPPESSFWMFGDTGLGHALDTSRSFVSSHIPDVELQPATKERLAQWFHAEARSLRAGDTLLLYVTDHGNRTGADPMTNTIQLWGRDQQLSVSELRAWLAELAPGVRVVSLMSQCFSGGFAGLSATSDAPGPDVCGYFSSTADRPAYGCFAENVGKERVGHSFHFIRALRATGRMSDAHAEVLATDDTPDVPLRSSDFYLGELLTRAANERSLSLDALVGQLLGPSWRDLPAWQSDRALFDRIAGAFGLEPPRSIDDLEATRTDLAELGRRLGTSANAWKSALSDAAGDNLSTFLGANPTWNARASQEAVHALSGDGLRSLSTSLLSDLVAWTHTDKGDRLDVLEKKATLADEGSYRTEVRIAAGLRLRSVLVSLAGRAYLDRFGTQAQRDGYAKLRACEDVVLPATAPPSIAGADVAEIAPRFPPLADEKKLESDVRPSWMGIGFNMVRDDLRKERDLPPGASVVTGVLPSSPAGVAGLRAGDLILGTPGKPFTARNQVRVWTMLSAAEQPETLQIRRAGKPIDVTIVPRPLPTDLPAAAATAGPDIGAAAPAIDLHRYRGATVNLKDGKAHLLLFWATWCKPCKASLPEALAFERAHHTQIVAITDEPKATLDAFFKTWKSPFPKTVAMDDFRLAFSAYAVGGTPTFVLIDDKGIVRARATGYTSPPGLSIDGWKWDGK